jgi:small-conductance mechanosensitive channel
VLAEAWVGRIRTAVADYRADRTPEALRRGGVLVAAATAALLLALFAVARLRRFVRARFETRLDARLQDLRIQDVPLVHARQIAAVARGVMRALWAAVLIALLFAYLEFALARFVWTRPFAERTLDLLLAPLRTMYDGLTDALPGLVFVALLALLVFWLLKAGKVFFDAVESGAVKLGGFEAEWATPTYRILRTVVIIFAMVIAYPYLPGSGSDAFKGISVFLGVMLSLGAASMIGNLLAGYSMIYRRAFRVGDRIRIGDTVGDVTQIRAMVTHLRTQKNEEVVVPNSKLLGEQVVNYSTLARTEGLILHTTVGIGYETPWRQVEAMLLLAASRTPNMKAEPAPFVLHNSLGDFCVVYELNVYVERAQGMNRMYTELHRSILDVFNEYGVQIMTPAYVADPEQAKLVPPSHWYEAPAKAASGKGGPAAPGEAEGAGPG